MALGLTLILSFLLCGLYLHCARRWQILDTPNERSSHRLPTPHGGGAGLLLAFLLGVAFSALSYGSWPAPYLLLSAVSLCLVLVGIADDLWNLPVRLRLPAYAFCCLLTAWVLMDPLGSESPVVMLSVLLPVALAMLWLVNLYNFMDGIDGIAALQCALACAGAALLAWAGGGGDSYPLFCLLLAAAHLGFLFWNWPPARLFMGDAGSIPSGYLLAALVLAGAVQGLLDPLCWLVLLAPFITDATWTLVWRMATGQPFTQAHRLHAYQRLSARWGSHLRVDLLLLLITALWLYPLAWAVWLFPGYALLLVILAYIPLLLAMAKVGSIA